MIKIIEEAPAGYVMRCKTCGCKFSYTLSDTHKAITVRYVNCPHCHDECVHQPTNENNKAEN